VTTSWICLVGSGGGERADENGDLRPDSRTCHSDFFGGSGEGLGRSVVADEAAFLTRREWPGRSLSRLLLEVLSASSMRCVCCRLRNFLRTSRRACLPRHRAWIRTTASTSVGSVSQLDCQSRLGTLGRLPGSLTDKRRGFCSESTGEMLLSIADPPAPALAGGAACAAGASAAAARHPVALLARLGCGTSSSAGETARAARHPVALLARLGCGTSSSGGDLAASRLRALRLLYAQ